MTAERDPQGMTRRQLIRHSAWFGAAVVLTVAGGEVISHVAGTAGAAHTQARPTLRFAQISDSHIGFTGTANANVTDTFTEAINQVNGLGYTPDFVIHTGDLTHLATPDQFDQVKQMLTGLNTPHIFTVPGEHDSVDDAGQKYRQAFGAGTRGDGWYSFDIAGVHVIALVNTLNFKKAWAIWALTNSTSSKRTSRRCPATPRSSCSATFRCSRCTRAGAGAPTTPPRR